MGQARNLLRCVGQGSLAGFAVGGVYGAWEVFLGEDFQHGLARLAAERLSSPMLAGALAGALLSTLLFLLFDALRASGRRAVTMAAGGVLFVFLLLSILGAFPLRDLVLPLHSFSSKPLSAAVFAAVWLLSLVLLLGRIREGIRPRSDGRAPLGGIAMLGWSLSLGALGVQGVVPRLPPSEAGRESIIIVSLDTLRADKVGFMGYDRPLTPNLDRFSRLGMVFEHASSNAPWTLPSHSSLFTSELPFTHGARFDHRPLRPANATLAERLRNAGYRTAAFTGGGYISARFGLGQGFEIYEEHDEGKEGGGQGIARAALAWIRSMGSRPYFAFVHTYEVHYPYTHDEFVRDPAAATTYGSFGNDELDAIHKGKRILTPGEKQLIADRYDGDVAAADHVMGGMLETLSKEGLLDRVVVVVLADHGEDLWDHDPTRSPGHGHSLYQELLHVPLLFVAPGVVPAGKRIQTGVSLVDVAATLLDLVGVPREPSAGRSLLNTLKTGAEPEEAPLLAESVEYGPDRFSSTLGSLKVVLAPLPEMFNSGVVIRVAPLEIFDLSSDPSEKTNLSAAPPRASSRMTEDLWKRVEAVFKPLKEGGQRGKIPEKLREQLRSLGYVQ